MPLALLLLALAHAGDADARFPSAPVDRVVTPTADAATALAHARDWLGTPYRWNGRGTARLPGLDCLGLLYRAWGPTTSTPWTAYPVNPSELVDSALLGAPVPGQDGVLRGQVDTDLLRPGDVLYLLSTAPIPDLPLWRDRGTPYWPWHTVLWVDNGEVIHAAPGDQVRVQPLEELAWDALFVTRPGSEALRPGP